MIVVFAEGATERRTRAQHVEEIPAHAHAGETLRLARHERRLPGADGHEMLEGAVPVAVVLERAEPELVHVTRAAAVANPHQPVRVRVWQRPQENGVDHAEDRGRRTDTEGESHESGKGERRRPPVGPGGISQILQKRFGSRDRLLVNIRVGELCLTSQADSGLAPRLSGAHPSAAKV